MEDNKNYVITVSREFGSGGRAIALKIGEMLDIPVYDRHFLEKIQEEYNLDKKAIDRIKGTRSNGWLQFAKSYRQQESDSNAAMREIHSRVTSQELYKAEEELLTSAAAEGPCVVLGRSSYHIFRNHPKAFKVMIVANREARLQRIISKYDFSTKDAEKAMEDVDKARDNYASTFSKTDRHDMRNFDMMLNVTGIPTDTAARLIAEAAKCRFGL